MIVILMDRLGPNNVSELLGHVFALCRCAFKSSGLITHLECTSD